MRFGDYPLLASYYHLQDQMEMKLAFPAVSPVRFYCGGNGPIILEEAGRIMDGVLISGMFIPFVRTGRLAALLAKADAGALQSGTGKRLRRVAELNVSISHNRDEAREFSKKYMAHAIMSLDKMGFTPDEYSKLGISGSDQQAIGHLKKLFDGGSTVHEAARAVPDSMVDAGFIAGTPEEVAENAMEFLHAAEDLGFDAIAFAKLGPDYGEALHLLSTEVLPKL